jgi:predicted RNA binding protein YcfA (HicA-like mRNA interferase family)
MKVSEILELLKRDGWYVARMRGSHAVTGSLSTPPRRVW